MNILKKFLQLVKNNHVFVLIIAIFVVLFYWLLFRPSLIRKKCHRWVVDLPGELNVQYESSRVKYESLYKYCLNSKGLK
jgi:type II secretory pathway component PulF